MGLVMHPATSASCVPLTVPVSSIGVVLITVASLAVSMVVNGEVVVVFETALTWSVRLLSFLAEVVRLVALACCVSVWVFVCPCSPHAGRLQRAVYRFCSRPLCFVP